ncbi:hypothetical protein LCGC14_2418680 [marine sediment metagenome]|uniref:ABC transmembrane type-1 domain-containing protein n=1 Tax=marine sediment metagenome TaxID=412755 RepID=A0A0F9BQF3_9ZZZZ
MSLSQSRSNAKRLAIYAAAAILAIYSAFPIYWMVISSMRPTQELFLEPTLVPRSFTFEYYYSLLAQTDYPRQFMNSLIVALSTVLLTMILAVMIASGVTRQRIRGKQMIIAGMLYAYMFPPLLLAIPLYSVFTYVGLNDTLLSLVISHLTITMPLGVWFLWGFFKTMPFELEEAAMVDGCTRLGAFLRVVLPLSVPGLVTVAIFAFLLSWTDYTFALVMIGSDANKTVPLGLASMIGAFDLRWGDIMAGSTLIALPLFVAFVMLSRYFVQGLTAGAVKG